MRSFNYHPTNHREFDKSMSNTDAKGNNAMHLTYKLNNHEIQSILSQMTANNFNQRNHKGLLPEEMNHKKLYEVDVD